MKLALEHIYIYIYKCLSTFDAIGQENEVPMLSLEEAVDGSGRVASFMPCAKGRGLLVVPVLTPHSFIYGLW